MAYDKQKEYENILQLIENDKHIVYISDVVAACPLATSTFYDFFPKDSEEMENIKAKIEANRIDLKKSMRTKWFDSQTPALQIGLYKLIAGQEERSALNDKIHIDMDAKIGFSDLSDEELDAEEKKYSDLLDD